VLDDLLRIRTLCLFCCPDRKHLRILLLLLSADLNIGNSPARSGDNYYDKLSLGQVSVASDQSGGVGSRFSSGESGRVSALGMGIGISVGANSDYLCYQIRKSQDYYYSLPCPLESKFDTSLTH
jgi:hypothetical protein